MRGPSHDVNNLSGYKTCGPSHVSALLTFYIRDRVLKSGMTLCIPGRDRAAIVIWWGSAGALLCAVLAGGLCCGELAYLTAALT